MLGMINAERLLFGIDLSLYAVSAFLFWQTQHPRHAQLDDVDMSLLLKFLERPKINISCQTIIFRLCWGFLCGVVLLFFFFFSLSFCKYEQSQPWKRLKNVRAGISSCLYLKVFLPHYHETALSLKNHTKVVREKEWKLAEGKWSFGVAKCEPRVANRVEPCSWF